MYYTEIVLDAKSGRLRNVFRGDGFDFARGHALISEFWPRIRIPSPWAQPSTLPKDPDSRLYMTDMHWQDIGRAIQMTRVADTKYSPKVLDQLNTRAVRHHLLGDDDPGIIIVNTCDRSEGLKTRDKNDVLWMVRRDPHGPDTLIISSTTEPSELRWILPEATVLTKKQSDSYPYIEVGELVHIETVLSPMRRKPGKTKAFAIRDHAERLEWGRHMIETKTGITITPIEGHAPIKIARAYRPDGDHHQSTRIDGQTVSLSLVRYYAIGTVTDVHQFQDAVRRGIGRAKAYGAGMVLAQRFYL